MWPTHTTKSGFRGRRPDFTVTVDGVASSDPSSVIAPFEVKFGHNTTDKDFGQLYGYMKQVTVGQPRRCLFAGILFNPGGTYVLTVTRNKNDWAYDVSPMVTLAQAIGHLNYVVIPGEGYSPYFPTFSLDLGNVLSRLGNPAFCAVATFKPSKHFETPPSGTRWVSPALEDNIRNEQVIVVKRTLPSTGPKQPDRPVRDEIKILYHLLSVAQQPNLPQLIFHSLDYQEMGILPYGVPIDPGSSVFKWPGILTDVLAALQWLHGNRIVHRDVRWDNVVYYVDHAVLIDLGASVYLDQDPIDSDPEETAESYITLETADRAFSAMPTSSWQTYAGGLICCPQRVIGNFKDLYTPQYSDDCRAFVQMTNMLLWPKFWEGLRSELVKDKDSGLAMDLVNFWADMRESRIWGKYVLAADRLEYHILAQIVELCLFLGSRS